MKKTKKLQKSKQLRGMVISNKMQKTVVVEVTRTKIIYKYGKRIKVNSKYKVHSDKKIDEGTEIIFAETKPMSKDKKWRFIKVVTK